MVKVVAVKFKNAGSSVYNSRDYYYKTFFDVEVGDLVVVDTSTTGYNVVMVSDIVEDPALQKKATKYLVQRVDILRYHEVIKKEKEIAAVKKAMDDRVRSLQETSIYEQLAKEDAQLAELLYQYKDMLQSL